MLLCPKCGKNSDEIGFIEAFCINCYPANIRCPESVMVRICKGCKKIRMAFGWEEYDPNELSKYVISKCKGEFIFAKYHRDTQKAVLTLVKAGKSIKIEKNIALEIDENYCKDCRNLRGGYYETILQFRGNREKVERVAKKTEGWLRKHSFVSKVIKSKDGIDIYSGKYQTITELAGYFGLSYEVSKTLVGRKEGKRQYKSTFVFRV